MVSLSLSLSLPKGMKSFLNEKPTPTTSHGAIFCILYVLALFGSCDFAHVPSSASKVGSCNLEVVQNNFDIIGCMASSQKYVTSYYLEKCNDLLGTDFHGFPAHECNFHNCDVLIHNRSNALVLSDLHLQRHLIGEGSHRRLISTIIFDIQADSMSWFEAHFCEAVIIERLPIGVFADPFELQSLVQRQVYLDAAVFGDTNLELPSALSNQSVFEVHMEIEHGNYSKSLEIVIELPLHARYPPLDPIGYSRVEIGPPDLFMRCRPRLSNEGGTFWWMVAHLVADAAGSHHNATWLIPCGHKGHTGFVSTVTVVVSALASSLLIVFSAKSDYIKGP